MKLLSSSPPWPSRKGGLATIIALAVLAILGTLLVVNVKVLSRLKTEIRMVEKKQVLKFQAGTNRVDVPGR